MSYIVTLYAVHETSATEVRVVQCQAKLGANSAMVQGDSIRALGYRKRIPLAEVDRTPGAALHRYVLSRIDNIARMRAEIEKEEEYLSSALKLSKEGQR